jgi:hypothetical protein
MKPIYPFEVYTDLAVQRILISESGENVCEKYTATAMVLLLVEINYVL